MSIARKTIWEVECQINQLLDSDVAENVWRPKTLSIEQCQQNSYLLAMNWIETDLTNDCIPNNVIAEVASVHKTYWNKWRGANIPAAPCMNKETFLDDFNKSLELIQNRIVDKLIETEGRILWEIVQNISLIWWNFSELPQTLIHGDMGMYQVLCLKNSWYVIDWWMAWSWVYVYDLVNLWSIKERKKHNQYLQALSLNIGEHKYLNHFALASIVHFFRNFRYWAPRKSIEYNLNWTRESLLEPFMLLEKNII